MMKIIEPNKNAETLKDIMTFDDFYNSIGKDIYFQMGEYMYRLHQWALGYGETMNYTLTDITNAGLAGKECYSYRISSSLKDIAPLFEHNFDDVFSTVPEEYISDFLIGFREATGQDSAKRVCYVAEAMQTEGKNLQITGQPSKSIRSPKKSPTPKKGKRDYIVEYIKDFEIGEAGETLVYNFECQRIENAKKKGLID